MDNQRPANRIGKIVGAAVLAIVLGTGVTVASPVSNVAANLASVMLMEDGAAGGSKPGSPTRGLESCSSAESSEESARQKEIGARLMP